MLVDQTTSGTAEWIAAALQDNHRAIIVGHRPSVPGRDDWGRSAGALDVKSRVPVGDGSWSIELVTGYLERGDGRRLSSDVTVAQSRGGRRGTPDHPVRSRRA